MFATEDEFLKLLENEEYVEVNKIRELASHGVPSEVRGLVWKYLLGVSLSDVEKEEQNKKDEIKLYTMLKKQAEDFNDIEVVQKRLASYQKHLKFFASPSIVNMFENIMVAYLCQKSHCVPYCSLLINLCGPLIYVYVTSLEERDPLAIESAIFFSFQAVLEHLDLDSEDTTKNYQHDESENFMSIFTDVFSQLLPDLHLAFEEEEFFFREWAYSWVYSLLGRELPLQCVFRLWDTYFSQGFDLHPYVCIAILLNCRDDIIEYELKNLRHFFKKTLPAMDMDKIIAQARNIKEEVEFEA